jgi:DNA-binding NtrC family response regulator
MSAGSTSARALNWFVRGGTVRAPSGNELTIGVDPVIVGRDAGATLSLNDREVSAFHCELRAQENGISVRDLGSTNGTFIGALRVRECFVTTETELVVGKSRLLIKPVTTKARVDVGYTDRFGQLVGEAPTMRRVFSVLEKVARSDLSILILGETGTGKEVVAKSVHLASERAKGPFIVVDCGSIPETLAESLLFGHEKGAFTGAGERKGGALLEANGGTLFLDELGELPVELQPKLLRALAERQIKRVGSQTYEPIDVRVLAATRRDLGQEMNAGRFRSDLFFRVAQVKVELPPLRERTSDIPTIVQEICLRLGHADAAPIVMSWLEKRRSGYDWPGNVRELVNVVQVAATLAHTPDAPDAIDDVLSFAHADRLQSSYGSAAIPTTSSETPGTAEAVFSDAKREAVAAFERGYFEQLVKATRGNISEMARRSGMERHHVRAFLRKYGIDRESGT